MMTAKESNPPTSIRFNNDDLRMLKALRKKLGVAYTQLVRLGIRALAEKEGLAA